jgi:hypothetical protein
VTNDDDDDNPRSSPGAAPRRSPPAPRTGRASVSCRCVPLWLPAGTLLPAPDSRGPVEVRGVVSCDCWAELEGRGPRLPYHFCIKKWKANPLVVCEEEPRRPDRCT